MVVTTSTKGTSATAAVKSSGRMFVTAPISRPPALPPRMTRRSAAVHPSAMSFSAQAMKSLNVFILVINRPCSYQGRPISPPPRT